MKIIRHRLPDGRPEWAVVGVGGKTCRIDGDIFGECRITDEVVQPTLLLSPIEPTAIVCIGLNYRKHAEETGARIPERPVVFMKLPSARQHPGQPILLPRHLASTRVDFEGELAIVIGRRCKNVSRSDALDHVFGYTAANDVSARDWQKEFGGGQWCRGKTFDTFCPLGPSLVTRDEIPDPAELTITTIVNDEQMQQSSVSDLIFDVPTLIEFLSGSTTLEPGTVILTGTPSGVGMARTPPRWLQPGDIVTVAIDRIGPLMNPVEEEPTA